MRNLKKILALALVFAMAFTFTASAADFTDKAEIGTNYVDDVNMLVELGVIAGYLEAAGCTIEACHVTGAAVECHVANSEANGDKCGVIVGHAGNTGVAVKDCTAANSTVTAGRDAGQIAGAAKEANVTGCSATNVTVTANGEGTGANIRNEVIGRIL